MKTTTNPLDQTITVLLLIGGKAETLMHGNGVLPEHLRQRLVDACHSSLEKDGREISRHRRGAVGQTVAILDVDEAELERHQPKGAPHPRELDGRTTFPSMSALCTFLGVATNRAYIELKKARARGEAQACIRGVTFSTIEVLCD